MALYFFVLFTLLKLALCLPDPNVKVGMKVDVDVDDKGCGGGGCNKKGCSFGGTVWPSGCILTEACFKLKCVDGTWKYTGDFDHGCGICNVTGDPHITTFDNFNLYVLNEVKSTYFLNKTGEYVITQPLFGVPALFGVNGNFEDAHYIQNISGSSILNITYYEPGIAVTLVLPRPQLSQECVEQFGHPERNPLCEIKVLVNKENRTIGDSVEVFYGTDGAILAFKHNDIDGDTDNLNCVNIVGSKGLSVSLCEYKNNYPFLYIWASSSLKSTPSQLYGLCNVFTGTTADDFVLQNMTSVTSDFCFPWHYDADICHEFSESWKVKK